MNGIYMFFWAFFSIVLGILYYRFAIVENPFRTKVIQSSLKVWEVLKILPTRVKLIVGGILPSIFQYDSSHEQDESSANTDLEAPDASGKWKWFEWIVIIVPIWVYCLPFLNLGSSYNLPGSETESFQAFDQVLEFSIKKYGQFPLWNPYFFTGMPYIAHPMLHAYNPFVSIPVMLFGVMDGFKIAVFLGFIIAGLGMWWLGKEVGLSRVGRVWVALMYAFCGVPAAKFIQGQYLMVMAFGWIPFSLAAMIAATRRKKRKYICIAAIGMALLFFSGNVYYAYYMLYVIALYAAISVFKLERKPFQLKIDWKDIKILVAIGILSLGLIAIQLLPLLQYRDQFIKPVNPELTDSQSIKDVFLDLVSPEPFRPGAFSDTLRPEEFYAYIGWWPLIGLFLLPLALSAKNKRYILFFLALIIFTFVWIDVKDMPWRSIFQTIPFIYQFRYPSRMIIVGAMSIVVAGGLGLDTLWNNVKKFMVGKPNNDRRRLLTGCLFALAIGIFMVWSVRDLASTSQPLLRTRAENSGQKVIIEWVRNFDPGIYYVDTLNNWHRAVIGNEIRYLNIWDAILVIPDNNNQISERPIKAEPNYLILPNDAAVPSDAILIKTIDTINIYRMTNSLPFAFTMSTSTLTTTSDTDLIASEVTPVTSVTAKINDMEVVVDSDSTGALVLLSSFSPDWQLTIDGRPTKVYNAYGYIAAEVNPGIHHYVFEYQPVWFFVGLITSIVTLLMIVWMLVADTGQEIINAIKKK